MDLDHLKRLLGLLTANGVTVYKDGDVELVLEVAAPPAPRFPIKEEAADPYAALMGRKARFPGSE